MKNDITIDDVEQTAIGEFKPFAHYDQFMDCIRVYTRDRSITEERVDESITIFRCNHVTKFDSEYVGFSLKGVKHALAEINFPMNKAYQLAELIDTIVKERPSGVNYGLLGEIFEDFKASGEWGDMTVDFTADLSRAA